MFADRLSDLSDHRLDNEDYAENDQHSYPAIHSWEIHCRWWRKSHPGRVRRRVEEAQNHLAADVVAEFPASLQKGSETKTDNTRDTISSKHYYSPDN
jgi:hypothetical protein